MRHFYLSLLVILALSTIGFTQSASAATSQNSQSSQNLENCYEGIGVCNPSKLAPSQSADLTALRHEKNLWGCLTGYGDCDRSALTQSEAKQVAQEKHLKLGMKVSFRFLDEN